jgi:IS4 transposase
VVTQAKQHEVRVARQLHFAPGIDRGYTDYEWFARLTQEGVYFVTRLKDNADYGVVEAREIPQREGVRRDQIIFFYKLAQTGVDCFFRRVGYFDEEKNEVLVFLTNHTILAAATVAAVYKERWQIEL